MTNYLVTLLGKRGYAFNSTADFEVVREIKEQCCFVSYDKKKDLKLARETTFHDKDFTLPDGKTIRIGAERFLCAEALFDPSVTGHEDGGYARKLYQAIKECPADCRVDLMQNIILTGGTTMFPGLSTRLYADLSKIYSEEYYKNNPKWQK